MNLQLKNSLILSGTLILGIIIGILVSGRIMHSKVENFRNFYTERGFNRQIMRVIKPTPEQKKALQPLLQEQAQKNQALFNECRKKHHELMESFREKLKDHLTKEQMTRLDKMEKNMRKRHGNGFPSQRKGNGGNMNMQHHQNIPPGK